MSGAHPWIGVGLGLSAAAAWSLANLSIREASRRLGPIGGVVWTQVVGAAMVIAVALALEGAPGRLGPEVLVALGIAGLSSAVAYVGLFYALEHGQLAVVSPIGSSWSAISVLGAALVGAEVPPLAAVGVGLVVVGNASLARAGASGSASGTRPLAVVAALLAAAGFGVMVPALDRAGAELGRAWAIPAAWAIELAVLVPLALALRRRRPGWRIDPPRDAASWLACAKAAALEAGGFVAVSVGLGFAPVRAVAPAASLSTALSVGIGLVLLRERLPRWAILGALAASLGVVLVGL